MIELTDEQLKKWVSEVIEDAGEPVLGPPAPDQDGRGVGIYLLELDEAPPARGSNRPPLQLWLRYLVTTWSDDATEAHRMLSDLVFDAMERTDFEVEFSGANDLDWSRFGVTPRPAFIVRLLLQKELPQPEKHPVLKPLVIEGTGRGSLRGVVLGPDDVPVTNATVEVPSLSLHTSTDVSGRFAFGLVPRRPAIKRLLVRARGRVITIEPDESQSEEPLVIRFDPTEV